MKLLGLFMLLFIGFIILFYYIYLVFVGKRLARLMNSKDRFIWNGLRNITDRASRGRATIFLDEKQLIISSLSLPSIYSKLKRGSLDEGLTIAFTDIAAFDYSSRSRIPFLRRIINYIFRINDYSLMISYIDDLRQITPLKFKTSSMDPLDFEATFADFNSKIYGDKGLRRRESGETPSLSQRRARDTTAPLDPAFRNDFSEGTVFIKEETSSDLMEETTILPRETFAQEEIQLFSSDSIIEEEVKDNLEKTVFLSGNVFEETPEKRSFFSRKDKIEPFEEKIIVYPSDSYDDGVEIVHREEAAQEENIIQRDSFNEEDGQEYVERTIFVPEDINQDKTQRKSLFSRRVNDLARDDTSLSTSPFADEDTSGNEEIKRRSFLDKPSVKKEEKPLEKKIIYDEDKTIALELPEELRKKDTQGVSQEEIKQQELERLQKLKEFFSERNEDQG